MDFNTIPSELLFAIFSTLRQIKALTSASRVAKRWRYASLDPILWKEFYRYYFPLDPLIPPDGQWYLAFVNKYKLFRAMRHDSVTVRSLLLKDYPKNVRYMAFNEMSMFKEDLVVVRPQGLSVNDQFVDLGCNVINIRTGENQVLSHEYHAKVCGDYTVITYNQYVLKMTAIRTPYSLDDINNSDIIGNEYNLSNTNDLIWNSDPKTPSVLIKENNQETYLFDCSTGERHPVLNFTRGLLYKDLICDLGNISATIYRNNIELYKYTFENKIEVVCMNQNLIAFVISREYVVHIIDMKTDQRTSVQIPHLTPMERRKRARLGGTALGETKCTLYIFDDILVVAMFSMLFFYDLNRAKHVLKISFDVEWTICHLLRASLNEFVCRAGSNLLTIRIELDPNPIKVLMMRPKTTITSLSVNGSKFASEILALLDESPILTSFYFIKDDQERFGIVYNFRSSEDINERAHELLKLLPNKENKTDLVHFKCEKCRIELINQEQNKNGQIRGPAIIFCERFINGQWQYAKPEHWPDVVVNLQTDANK